LWGESVAVQTDTDALVADTLAGFAITPIAPVAPATDPPQSVPDDQARYSTVQIDGAFGWVDGRTFRAGTEQGAAAAGRALGASAARDLLLTDLGVDEEVTVGSGTVDAFLVAPLVGNLIGQ
jgi:hypothetical protein